jgi:hypothetical protein
VGIEKWELRSMEEGEGKMEERKREERKTEERKKEP